MKILVDSKLINHAWQHVMNSGPANESKDKAVEILASILRKEDSVENDVEKVIDDLELKYHRIEHSISSINIVHDIQELRTKLGLNPTTDEKTTNPVEIDGFKKLTDIVSDMADIMGGYLWNTHTNESERSARLLDDTIKELEELRNENIGRT